MSFRQQHRLPVTSNIEKEAIENYYHNIDFEMEGGDKINEMINGTLADALDVSMTIPLDSMSSVSH